VGCNATLAIAPFGPELAVSSLACRAQPYRTCCRSDGKCQCGFFCDVRPMLLSVVVDPPIPTGASQMEWATAIALSDLNFSEKLGDRILRGPSESLSVEIRTTE
jgi:hypothetical protein